MPINSNYIGVEQSITIQQVDYLDTIINNKSEELMRIENNLLAEENTRFTNDQTLQSNIDEKLAEANSVFMPNYTKYIVNNRDSFQDVINSITNQATVVNISQGSFSGSTPFTINKQNIALIGQASTPPIVEFAFQVNTDNDADRIRMRYLSFDGVFVAGSSRSVYTDTTFNDNVFITKPTLPSYMSFVNCEFASDKSINVAIDFNSVCYFINCNFAGATLSLLQSLPQQVIINNCAGLVSYPTNALLVGLNVLTSGVSQNNISQIILPSGSGTSGQVLTSGGAGNVNTWTTPSGGGSSGVCLESISVIPTGQTITTKSGETLTFENVNAVIDVLQRGSFSELGGRLTYLPPSGTKLVKLTYTVKVGYTQSNSSQQLLMSCRSGDFPPSLSNTSITHSEIYMRSQLGFGECPMVSLEAVINIDASLSDDIANGTLQSWTIPKQFYFIGSKITQNVPCKVHSKNGYDGSFSNQFAPPVLKIEAFS